MHNRFVQENNIRNILLAAHRVQIIDLAEGEIEAVPITNMDLLDLATKYPNIAKDYFVIKCKAKRILLSIYLSVLLRILFRSPAKGWDGNMILWLFLKK